MTCCLKDSNGTYLQEFHICVGKRFKSETPQGVDLTTPSQSSKHAGLSLESGFDPWFKKHEVKNTCIAAKGKDLSTEHIPLQVLVH